MANSFGDYTGTTANPLTGTTFQNYNVNFISESHLKVLTSTDNGTNFSTTSITVTVTGNVATLSSAPSTGSDSINRVRIYRETPTGNLVDFQAGARLLESDLDTAYSQSLFVSQEL